MAPDAPAGDMHLGLVLPGGNASPAAESTTALTSGPADPFARAWRDWYAQVHDV
jgi:hypothetical protein